MKFDCSKTIIFFKEKDRMCESYICENCPLDYRNNERDVYCHEFTERYTEDAVKIVQKWSDENSIETRAEHFFRTFQNCGKVRHRISGDWVPVLKVCTLNNKIECCEIGKHCDDCWLELYKEGDF